MPTPAAQYPSNPSTPWVQCPEDVQYSRRTSWQPDGPLERSGYFGEVASPLEDIIEREASASTESATVDGVASGGMSPRDGPISRSNITAEGEIKSTNFKADMSRDSSPTAELPEFLSDQHRNDTPSPDLPALGEEDGYFSPSMGSYVPTGRTKPILASSHLRPGSRFHGTQQSERQVYDVQVEIKHVDLRESFLCGYLRIQGLTEDHPTLTTYFEGEIIGPQYSFFTQHEDWGASHKVDLSHWSKFNAFRPYQKAARRGPVHINDVAQKDTIFMRWKEHFLVPDHRVRTITGASFEGFYYIAFDQVKGDVNGIYFHSKSEKFQQLELKHVPDRGCFSASELR